MSEQQTTDFIICLGCLKARRPLLERCPLPCDSGKAAHVEFLKQAHGPFWKEMLEAEGRGVS